MSVRPARSSDHTEIAELRLLLWSDRDGADDGETFFVWDAGDGPIGGFVSVSIRPWADGCRSSPVPYVEGWFVRDGHRRLGIGRALMDAAEEWALSLGYDELGSDALLDNTGSLRAHRRLGFQPTERLQCLSKDLGASPVGESATIDRYEGERDLLRASFELAEDSPEALAAHLDLGEVLVAKDGALIVGHIQLVSSGDGQLEIRNMAVEPTRQGRGIGRSLVEAALAVARERSVTTVHVATAAADVGNLRFYQRLGFRLARFEQDAFTPATGYPTPILIDGIELRDRVWLELAL